MLSELEIRAIAANVVQRAKATARVDQGTLKRSISYTYVKGQLIFRQMYYGVYYENSQLERIARDLIPYGIDYKIELTDLGGNITEVGRTKSGRKTLKSVVSNALRNNSPKIRSMISKAIKKRKDGEAQE